MSTLPLAVIAAKVPIPGQVKTRLIGDLTAEAASELAWAFLRCTVCRLRPYFDRLVIAGAPDDGQAAMAAGLDQAIDWEPQGGGDLGERLERVWRSTGAGPIAFFGMDTPDVPDDALRAVVRAAGRADIAVGPTDDGGYWTLMATSHHPAVLRQIDWGSERVYDQTVERVRSSGLRFESLPGWPDVDVPEDLTALRQRLAALHEPSPPLRQLALACDRTRT